VTNADPLEAAKLLALIEQNGGELPLDAQGDRTENAIRRGFRFIASRLHRQALPT
jgi:hypothetical protein